MAGETHTIRGSFGLDTKPVKESLDDIKRYAETKAGEIKKAVQGATSSRGPSGGGPPKGGEGGGPPEGGEGGGVLSALRVTAGAIALRGLTALLTRAAQAGRESRDEVKGLERETHKLIRTADFSSSSEKVEELTQKYAGLRKENRKLTDELGDFSEKRHPVTGSIKHLGEQLRGRESLFGGPSESETKLTDAREKVLSRMSDLRTKISVSAGKELEIAKAQVSEGNVGAQMLKERAETEERIAGLRKREVPESTIEKIQQASDVRLKSMRVEEAATIRQEQSRQRIVNIQRGLAVALNSATTEMEKQSLVAHASLETEKEKLAAANQAVETSKNQGRVEQAAARAQQGEAMSGVAKAAGGVADTEASSFEARANEYNMTPAQKGDQYSQRLAQYRSLDRYARATGQGGTIDKPVIGAVEYDPQASRKAARASELTQQAQRESQQQEAQQAAEAARATQRSQASKFAQGLGLDINNPNVDVAKLAEMQRNKDSAEALYGSEDFKQSQQPRPKASGYIKSHGMWHSLNPDDAGANPQFSGSPMDDSQSGMPPPIQPGVLPTPTPSALPSPSTDQQGGGIADKVGAAVAAVMREFWGR